MPELVMKGTDIMENQIPHAPPDMCRFQDQRKHIEPIEPGRIIAAMLVVPELQ